VCICVCGVCWFTNILQVRNHPVCVRVCRVVLSFFFVILNNQKTTKPTKQHNHKTTKHTQNKQTTYQSFRCSSIPFFRRTSSMFRSVFSSTCSVLVVGVVCVLFVSCFCVICVLCVVCGLLVCCLLAICLFFWCLCVLFVVCVDICVLFILCVLSCALHHLDVVLSLCAFVLCWFTVVLF